MAAGATVVHVSPALRMELEAARMPDARPRRSLARLDGEAAGAPGFVRRTTEARLICAEAVGPGFMCRLGGDLRAGQEGLGDASFARISPGERDSPGALSSLRAVSRRLRAQPQASNRTGAKGLKCSGGGGLALSGCRLFRVNSMVGELQKCGRMKHYSTGGCAQSSIQSLL